LQGLGQAPRGRSNLNPRERLGGSKKKRLGRKGAGSEELEDLRTSKGKSWCEGTGRIQKNWGDYWGESSWGKSTVGKVQGITHPFNMMSEKVKLGGGKERSEKP